MGTVSDVNTGQPIENARVFVSTLSHLSDISDTDGQYEIIGVPFDTLYVIEATQNLSQS